MTELQPLVVQLLVEMARHLIILIYGVLAGKLQLHYQVCVQERMLLLLKTILYAQGQVQW